MPTEWVKKFVVKSESEVMLLKGGQSLKFNFDIENVKDIPKGSYLGVEVFGSCNLGNYVFSREIPCFEMPVSSVLNAFNLISQALYLKLNAETVFVFNFTLYLKDSES